jgi:hypothetical protein
MTMKNLYLRLPEKCAVWMGTVNRKIRFKLLAHNQSLIPIVSKKSFMDIFPMSQPPSTKTSELHDR